jgi:hypothetical protein
MTRRSAIGVVVLCLAFTQFAWLGGGKHKKAVQAGALAGVSVCPARPDTWRGVRLNVMAIREDPLCPVVVDLSEVTQSLESSFRKGGAEFDRQGKDKLSFRIVFSKFDVKRFSRKSYRCYADFTYTLSDAVTGDRVDSSGVRSLSGRGATPTAAAVDALRAVQGKVFADARLTSFLAKRRLSREGMIGLKISTLVADLKRSAVKALSDGRSEACRIALAEIKGDPDRRIGALVLPELQKVLSPPDFEFYSRTQLDQILKEQSLQMSDFVDEITSVEVGMLKGVDYLVTGTFSDRDEVQILHLQINSVADGKVVGSASARITKAP